MLYFSNFHEGVYCSDLPLAQPCQNRDEDSDLESQNKFLIGQRSYNFFKKYAAINVDKLAEFQTF